MSILCSSSSSDEDDDNDMMMLMFLKEHTNIFVDRFLCRTSVLSGKEYVREINCIGAIDGTHVAACAPASKQKTFRANDSRVFYNAILRSENKFLMPTGGCEGVRGKHELFNFMHSSVRNVIEQAFGVLKARFHILKDIPNYPLRCQMLIPQACCALHNYIRMEDRVDRLFNLYGEDYDEVQTEGSNIVEEGLPLNMTNNDEMVQVRNEIANDLWEKYTSRRAA
nr:protein ALP1-like [Tanacetum cinerariifolium]